MDLLLECPYTARLPAGHVGPRLAFVRLRRIVCTQRIRDFTEARLRHQAKVYPALRAMRVFPQLQKFDSVRTVLNSIQRRPQQVHAHVQSKR